MKFEKKPPEILYLGISINKLEEISENGLKENSEPIYLYESKYRAFDEEKVKNSPTSVLKIDALKMYKDGYVFSTKANNVWLISEIPSQYIDRLPVGKGERFDQGDVYVEDPFESVMFRYDLQNNQIYVKFYGKEESKTPVPHDNRLFNDTLLTGFEITKDEYIKGKERDEF